MGFSAGGHLASSFSVHYDDVKIENKEINLRPDFSILIYPVISLLESPHVGSGKNLLGAAATHEQLTYFSAERNVNAAILLLLSLSMQWMIRQFLFKTVSFTGRL